MTTSGSRAPDGCSALSAGLDEPLAGTAPYALGWLAIEQPGPWGRNALTGSRLDVRLGARIEQACAAVDVRPALVRRPGRDPLPPSPGHRVLAACTVPGRTFLLTTRLEHLGEVAWESLAAAVAEGDAEAVRRLLPRSTESEPHLLVCTNGRRDLCCALQGRPVALEAGAKVPDRVWEATHLGGHRFAPTAAVLPSGMVHGRLDTAAALGVLEAAEAGQVDIATARGRTTWPAPGQAAELAVRRLLTERSSDALSVSPMPGAGDGSWSVRHVDGRTWLVSVTEEVGRTSRPESCGKAALPVCSWVAGAPLPLP